MTTSFNPQQSNRLYRAFLRKDPRLEGRAFIAVRTTGIYCLLTCRARTPRRENVSFFPTRAAATLFISSATSWCWRSAP